MGRGGEGPLRSCIGGWGWLQEAGGGGGGGLLSIGDQMGAVCVGVGGVRACLCVRACVCRWGLLVEFLGRVCGAGVTGWCKKGRCKPESERLTTERVR